MIPDLATLRLAGMHGYGNSFADSAILKIYDQRNTNSFRSIMVEDAPSIVQGRRSPRSPRTQQPLAIRLIASKAVIQQQGTRACVAACAAMLIYDNLQRIDLDRLRRSNLTNNSTLCHWLQQAGLQVRRTINTSLLALSQTIAQHGPAIVSVDSGIGGHVVIVDRVEAQRITLRDPWHGWMIDVRPENFKFDPECIQVRRSVPDF